MTPRNSIYFPALTGLRAIAAFLVFFSHNNLPPKYFGSFISAFTNELYIGVSIFFVLSGFLITIRYQENFQKNNYRFRRYFQNRFARIYPMYFILTTLTFLFYKSDQIYRSEPNHVFVYLMNITFMKAFFSKLIYTGIPQGWTLTVEECFYFLAPLIVFFNKKIKLIWMIPFFYLPGLLLVCIFKHINFFGFFDGYLFMFVRTFFGRCFEFFTGIMLAKLYNSGKKNILFFSGYCTLSGAAGILITVLLLTLTVDPKAEYALGIFSYAGALINNLLLPVSIGIFIWGLIHEQTILRKLLESKVFILLGKSSYSFYLIHMGFIEEAIRLSITHNYLYNFPFLVILSIILFKTVEEPLNLYFRKLRLSKT